VDQERDPGSRKKAVLETPYCWVNWANVIASNRAGNRLGIDRGVNINNALQGLR
jgi:hypothetical protein